MVNTENRLIIFFAAKDEEALKASLRTEVHNIVQETEIKTIPMEKKCKK